MIRLRLALGTLALGLLALLVTDAAAQRGVPAPTPAPYADGYYCPNCNKEIDGMPPPSTCPHCKTKLNVVKNADGTYQVTEITSEKDPRQKYFLWGGGALLVVGLIGVALKYTVFKAPPPKKKKKKRREDDDEEEERHRKKKRPVMQDEDERPRKKKPRIVEDDDE